MNFAGFGIDFANPDFVCCADAAHPEAMIGQWWQDDTAVTDCKAVDAATVAAVQTKREATHATNKKAKVGALAAARLACCRTQLQRQIRYGPRSRCRWSAWARL